MNAVVTIAIGDTYQSLAKMTHASIKAYAEKIGAEFIVIDRQRVSVTSAHYEKFQIADLLNKYERIIYIDTDVIVRDDCPNLFEIVPENRLGAFDEGAIMERRQALLQCAADYNEPLKNEKTWDGRYYNTGVMVISRMHKDLFKRPEKEIWNYYEQSYLNLQILNREIRMFNLDYKFNRMHALDKKTGEHRLVSYIVHYAGVLNGLDKVIPIDLARWKSGEWKTFRRNIIIGVGQNRLGDNVCAEPTVRFIVNNSPDCNITIQAVFPQLFKHLSDKARVCRFDEFEYEWDQAYLHIETACDELSPLKKQITCDSMNMVDFTSIVSIKRTLNDADREIRLGVTPSGIAEVLDVAEKPVKDMVLVHPGKAWPSKTFPAGYWNEIIGGIAKSVPVGVIGADMSLGRGTVPVDLPDNVVDFRNLLSVEGLVAAISMTKALVTNDSGPMHIAGAFDNGIVLLPTCKHPDLVLPMRKGNKYYKTRALYKKINDKYSPEQPLPNLVELEGDICDYLPAPSTVIEAAIGFCTPQDAH